MKRKLQLPVVFDYDEQLSMDYKNKDGSFTMVNNHAGKWLFMDKHGGRLKEPKY